MSADTNKKITDLKRLFFLLLLSSCPPQRSYDTYAKDCSTMCASAGMEVLSFDSRGICACRMKQEKTDCSKEWERSYDALALWSSCRQALQQCKNALGDAP